MKIWEQITEETWCQMSQANGDAHCLEGWVNKVYSHLTPEERFQIKAKLMMAVPCLILTQWNDEDGTRWTSDPKTGARWSQIPARTFKDVWHLCRKVNI